MSTLLYEEQSILTFLFVTVALGGGAAWLSGRAIALTWRPWWTMAPTAFVLGLAVRFFHHALFGATLLSAHYFAVDAAIAALFVFAGFRFTRSRQMALQYGFLRRN
jgi:hypothetical protein